MKLISALLTVLLAGFAAGAPTHQSPIIDANPIRPCVEDVLTAAAPDVTLSLANDFSGANARATFPADGTSLSITKLYGGTIIGASGSVQASSGQLTQIPNRVACTLKDRNGLLRAALTSTTTFVSFGGTITLDGWTVKCVV